MKTYNSLEELQNDSILVRSGMISHYPQFNYDHCLDVSYASQFNNCFAVTNSTIAYISNDLLYVTPYTRGAIRFLIQNGFLHSSFPIPFSNSDYPKNEKEKWFDLCKSAAHDCDEVFTHDCINWSIEHGIKEIDGAILAKCFLMPPEGIHVINYDYEGTYYPVINGKTLDWIAFERLGTFCSNNGIVLFVHRDGQTYIAKGTRIIDILRTAGYKEKSLFVPFSNGEMIINTFYSNQWKNTPKI